MCISTKFGFLPWNRHKWYMPHKDFRVCRECGRTETQADGGFMGGSYWTWTSLDEWLNEMESTVRWHKMAHPSTDGARALAWLSGSGLGVEMK